MISACVSKASILIGLFEIPTHNKSKLKPWTCYKSTTRLGEIKPLAESSKLKILSLPNWCQLFRSRILFKSTTAILIASKGSSPSHIRSSARLWVSDRCELHYLESFQNTTLRSRSLRLEQESDL
jgi:hypothetical protein